MATRNDIPSDESYSSGVKKTLNLNNDDLLSLTSTKSVTFAAATTGKVAAHTIATVTGVVALSIFAVCGTNVAGSGTIEVGTAASTAALIAQTTGTDIDANDIWHDASPDASIELTSVITKNIVTDDVIYTIASDTLTSGEVTFYIKWSPISSDGYVTIA